MSFETDSTSHGESTQPNLKRKIGIDNDIDPYAPWRVVNNTELIDGKLRIRKFNIDYMDGPVADADVVIKALPRTKLQHPGSTSRYKSLKRLQDDDLNTTLSSMGSEHLTPDQRQSARNQRRSRRNLINRSKATEETITALNDEFEHMSVYNAGVSLGRFDPDIHYAAADPAVALFLQTPEGKVPDFNPDDWCFMESNGGAQMLHLKMFNQPTLSGPDFTQLDHPEGGRHALESAIDYVQDMLQLDTLLPRLGTRTAEDVTYNPKKSSGVHYRLQGLKTRGEAYERALAEAKLALVALLSGEYVEPRPTRMGGRGKPVHMSEEAAREANVIKGRAIHMTDTRDHIILGYSEQDLNDAWKHDRFPISVGRGWFHGDASRFIVKLEDGKIVYCFDAEKFDASLMPWLIHIAITIMRMQYTDGLDHEFDMYWHFVEESLLHSFVFRDDGILFEKRHGTSSGHNHNSLAQSIITNILAVFHAFYTNPELDEATIRENLMVEGLGDDNITIEGGPLRTESVEERGMRTWVVFGVSWLGTKSFATETLCQPPASDATWNEREMYGSAQYLGKYFRYMDMKVDNNERIRIVVPYRPLAETVVRLLYPEGVGKGKEGEELAGLMQEARGGRLMGHYADGSGNPLTRRWLDEWASWAIEHGFEFPAGESNFITERMERMNADLVEGAVEASEDYEVWLKLIGKRRDGAWESVL